MGITATNIYIYTNNPVTDVNWAFESASSGWQRCVTDLSSWEPSTVLKLTEQLSQKTAYPILFLHLFDSHALSLCVFLSGKIVAQYSDLPTISVRISAIPILFGFEDHPKRRLSHILSCPDGEEKIALLEEYFGIPFFSRNTRITILRGDTLYRAFAKQESLSQKNIILDCHSTLLSSLFHSGFMSPLHKIAQSLSSHFDMPIQAIQLYDCYYLSNGIYPFTDEEKVYYPLSVILKNRMCQMVWIEWKKAEAKATDVYAYPFGLTKPLTLYISEVVPGSFLSHIEGKHLFWLSSSTLPRPVIHTISPLQSTGKYHQAFIDVLSRQIGTALKELSKQSLPPTKWELRIKDTDQTTVIGSRKYRTVYLSRVSAFTLPLHIMWEENYDVGDYVEETTIHFHLAEAAPRSIEEKIKEIVSFIQHDGQLC